MKHNSLPNPTVTAKNLFRPDWTSTVSRNPELLWLDKNENTDSILSETISKVVQDLDPNLFFSYPDLKQTYYKLSQYVDLPAKNLRLTAGSDGAIHSVFEAYISKGDKVLYPTPTFAMYSVYCQIFGAKEIKVAYLPSEKGPFLSVESFCNSIKEAKPKLICLANPGSPTGTIFNENELKRIIEIAYQVNSLILIDEAYHPFYNKSVITWTKKYSHLITIRSTGKAWGMAGFRVGYAATSDEISRNLHKVRPMYEIGAVSSKVFEAMIDQANEMEASVIRLEEGRLIFISEMEQLGFKVIKTYGNFQHIGFGKHADKIHKKLSNVVLYRQDFSEPCLKGYSRFSLTSVENFTKIIKSIKIAMK